MENRKEWPLPIMRSVLQDLMDETPSDLLAKSVQNFVFHFNCGFNIFLKWLLSIVVVIIMCSC